MDPNLGDRVMVYPRPGHRVQVDGIIGRFLAGAGEEVMWSEWYHERRRDGSISLYPFVPVAPKADAKGEK